MTGADHYLQLAHGASEIAEAAKARAPSASGSMIAAVTANSLASATVARAASLIERSEFGAANDLIVLSSRALAVLSASVLQDESMQETIKDLLGQIAEAREPISPEASTSRMTDDDLRALGIEPER